MNGNFPPSPFDPLPQLNLYTDGTLDNYWYDDRDFDMQAYQTQSAAVAANRSARGAYSTGGGISSSGQSMPPGALWLQITGISNSIVSLNLNGATDTVYEVWSKTDLQQTNLNIEQEVFPTNQQVMVQRPPEEPFRHLRGTLPVGVGQTIAAGRSGPAHGGQRPAMQLQ